jgi:hypothetical protein
MVDEASAPEIRFAQWLLISILFAMFISASATAGLEIICYGLFATSRTLRIRLVRTLQTGPGICLAVFVLAIVVGALHGLASWDDRLGALVSWRKILLFFLAAAVFEDDRARRTFIAALSWLCLIAVVLSYLTCVIPISHGAVGRGIVLKDSALQGLVFAVGAAATMWSGLTSWNAAVAGLLVMNIAFVTPGRIGYLALVILAAALGLARNVKWAVLLLLACVSVLAASPLVRERIAKGVGELENYSDSPVLTSMGWRVVMWRNTVEIIREHPILGVGTGSFEAAYRRKIEGGHGWQAQPTNDPHNFYLKVLTEQGVAGLFTFLAFIVFAVIAKSPIGELHRGVLVVFCAANLFASDFSRSNEGRFMFLWLGMALAGVGASVHRSAERISTPG